MVRFDASNFNDSRPELPVKSHRHGLFVLPPELRTIVYMFALVNPDTTVNVPLKKSKERKIKEGKIEEYDQSANSQNRGLTPSFLRVSRQVYNEALPILYSNNFKVIVNSFEFDGFFDASQARLSRSPLRFMTYLSLVIDLVPDKGAGGGWSSWLRLRNVLHGDCHSQCVDLPSAAGSHRLRKRRGEDSRLCGLAL